MAKDWTPAYFGEDLLIWEENGKNMLKCAPPIETHDNDFHEVWWNSWAGGVASEGKPKHQLHEVWQWMGDAPNPGWCRPGEADRLSAEDAHKEGWRYVRRIQLLDEVPRMAGEPPTRS